MRLKGDGVIIANGFEQIKINNSNAMYGKEMSPSPPWVSNEIYLKNSGITKNNLKFGLQLQHWSAAWLLKIPDSIIRPRYVEMIKLEAVAD